MTDAEKAQLRVNKAALRARLAQPVTPNQTTEPPTPLLFFGLGRPRFDAGHTAHRKGTRQGQGTDAAALDGEGMCATHTKSRRGDPNPHTPTPDSPN